MQDPDEMRWAGFRQGWGSQTSSPTIRSGPRVRSRTHCTESRSHRAYDPYYVACLNFSVVRFDAACRVCKHALHG